MGTAADHPQELHAVRGVDHAVDQVQRREQFEAGHPQWRIWVDRDSHIWNAERMLDGGRDTVRRLHLRDLLDALGAP